MKSSTSTETDFQTRRDVPGAGPGFGHRPGRKAAEVETLSVPAGAWDLTPFEFPSSARLEGLFRKKRVKRLGELDGVALEDLRRLGNCGPRTLTELVHLLKRIRTGDFAIPADLLSPANLAGLLQKLDATIADLPAREREILLLRLGASKDHQFWTLQEVGDKYHLTRERVRQIMDLIVPLVRKEGGPALAAQLREIAARCQRNICPLTPALLEQWLGRLPATCRFALPVYVRIMGELNPDIPAWPLGQEYRTDPRPGRLETAMQALRRTMHSGKFQLSVKSAFAHAIAEPGLQDLKVGEFLGALKHARSLTVEFPKPDQPQVHPRWIGSATAVRAVLEASDRPLTVDQIASRIDAQFGRDLQSWSLPSLERTLRSRFYRLGSTVFGLRQHFSMAAAQRRKACADVSRLLKKHDGPLSVYQMLKGRSFAWSSKTNPYELAEILREDTRFVEGRKLRFWLAH